MYQSELHPWNTLNTGIVIVNYNWNQTKINLNKSEIKLNINISWKTNTIVNIRKWQKPKKRKYKNKRC